MKSEFLENITKRLYDKRMSLDKNQKVYCRYEKVDNGIFAEIWFMTEGCKHDRNGGCTMCNYGKGHKVEDEGMLSLIDGKLTEINSKVIETNTPLKQLIISPTGSMFDEEEVSNNLRNGIFRLVGKYKCEKFIVETRVDTITAEKLSDMKSLIPHKNIAIELGLESANPWVLKNCVNKNLNIEDFEATVKLIKQAGFMVTANISLGAPFLDEKSQIEDTINTVKWAQEVGVDTAVVFPIHAKPGTLVGYLYENNMYECVSLWSLVEVLKKMEEQSKQKVEISWYKSYYDDPKKIIESPNTCHDCREDIIKLLDEYKNSCSSEVIKQLYEYDCHCKDEWKKKISKDIEVNADRLVRRYEKLGELFNIDSELVNRACQDARTSFNK